jgi:hypothetical protein
MKYDLDWNSQEVLTARAIKDYFAAKSDMKDAEAFLKSVKAHHFLKEIASINSTPSAKKATKKSPKQPC